METQQAPLAFIYDRHATPTEAILLLRLENCRQYAERMGWEIAGEWVDRGDVALCDDNRPAFEEMLEALAKARQEGRQAVCLIHDWVRFSRDDWERKIFVRRITLVRGRVETAAGETSNDTSGRLTKAPLS